MIGDSHVHLLSKCIGSAKNLLAMILLLVCPVVFGQSVLVATTSEVGGGPALMNNLILEFSPFNPVIDQTELSNSQAPAAGFFDGYDVVIIASVYGTVDATDWTAIGQAMQNNTSASFVFFTDSCSTCGTNAAEALSLINAQTPDTLALDTPINQAISANLNGGSPYAASFSGVLDVFSLAFLSTISGVTADNALYTDVAGPVGIFYPESETAGSCLFYTDDMSGFAPIRYPDNQGSVAPAFIDAATNSIGSCARSSTGNYVVAVDDSYVSKPALTLQPGGADFPIIVDDNDTEGLSEGLQVNPGNTDSVSSAGGAVAVSGNILLYTPLPGFTGEDTFSYEICVPSGACDAAIVTVLVAVASPPQAVPVLPAHLLLVLIGLLGLAGGASARRNLVA
jgi:hypothetical protein